MIFSFRDQGTQDIYNGLDSRSARRVCPIGLWSIARRKLDQLNRVEVLRELAIPPGNRLERLSGDRHHQHSIRINQQFRICFTWTDTGARNVEITDYH